MEDQYLLAHQAQLVRQQHHSVLMNLRPDAVALVDSFGFEDYVLNSCLGRYDKCHANAWPHNVSPC